MLTVAGSPGAGGTLDGHWQHARTGQVHRVEINLGHAAVKPIALCVTDGDSATATSAVMTPNLRAATATRVWQRQSIECIAAVWPRIA